MRRHQKGRTPDGEALLLSLLMVPLAGTVLLVLPGWEVIGWGMHACVRLTLQSRVGTAAEQA